MKFLIEQKIQADWWSKTFAGAVLGLSLAVGVAALITVWALQNLDRALAPQIGMWSVPWLWLPLFFIAYFIPKGWQSIVIYSVLNFIAYGLVFVVRGG